MQDQINELVIVCPQGLNEVEAVGDVRLIAHFCDISTIGCLQQMHGHSPNARPRSMDVVFDAISAAVTSGPYGMPARRI
jgi:hypothetical protein